MAKIYYGNGNCEVEGKGINIRGVQIKYSGSIAIEDKTSPSFAIAHKNNIIIVFPIGEGNLNELFYYEGEFKILSVIVADSNGEQVKTIIKRVMDYSELLSTNAEDMTNLSEDLSTGYLYGKKPIRASLKQDIIPNLNSSHSANLYYSDGKKFSGSFHIHLNDSTAMSGATHTEDSQELYYMRVGERLTPTKNPSHIPQSARRRPKFYRKKR